MIYFRLTSRFNENYKLSYFNRQDFHWGFIILYTYGMVKQLDDLSQLEDAGLLYFEVVFSIIFLLIVVFRYLYMRKYKTFLGASKAVPMAHQYLAKAIHISMYLCLVLLPLSGLFIAGLYTLGITRGLMQDFCGWFTRILCIPELSSHHNSCGWSSLFPNEG